MSTAPDAVHHLVIDTKFGEPVLRLVCTATKGADCRLKPTNADELESWYVGDPDLTFEDAPCWAVEWIEDAGWDDGVRCAAGAKFPSWPVEITYDEGVVIAPVEPHPLLDVAP